MTSLKTYFLTFKKDGRDVTYIHDEQGLRFEVERNDGTVDIVTVDSPDGMNFVMNLLAGNGYESAAII